MDDARHERHLTDATRGDRAAVEALLAEHMSQLLAYVRLHAGPALLERESAAEVVQAVCREVLGGLDGFRLHGAPAFRKWLFTAALNKIRERGRRAAAARRDAGREVHGVDLAAVLPSFTTPSQVAILEEDMRRLEAAFARLDEQDRFVITAAKLIGQSHAEIGRELGKSPGAVRVQLHRALFRLGEAIGGGGSDGGSADSAG